MSQRWTAVIRRRATTIIVTPAAVNTNRKPGRPNANERVVSFYQLFHCYARVEMMASEPNSRLLNLERNCGNIDVVYARRTAYRRSTRVLRAFAEWIRIACSSSDGATAVLYIYYPCHQNARIILEFASKISRIWCRIILRLRNEAEWSPTKTLEHFFCGSTYSSVILLDNAQQIPWIPQKIVCIHSIIYIYTLRELPWARSSSSCNVRVRQMRHIVYSRV